MKPSTLVSLMRGGRGTLLLSLARMYRPFYRVAFLGAALSSGLLRRLARGPVPFEELTGEFAPQHSTRDGFMAWLDLGVILGDLKSGSRGFGLRSRFAKRLALEANDPYAAAVVELATLEHFFITQTPERLRQGRRFTLADQNGPLVARSSRVVEPLIREAVESIVPKQGTVRLLEVGCGSGIYIRHAAELNPLLSALGLELQLDVARVARRNLEQWGLSDRASVETGDVLRRAPQAAFDIVTLHNNVYYFPAAERASVLMHLARFLKPGGCLLITTVCGGANAPAAFLNLWGAMTEGCGPLPTPAEMIEQLRDAGFDSLKAKSLLPASGFYSFTGRRPVA